MNSWGALYLKDMKYADKSEVWLKVKYYDFKEENPC